MPIYLDNYGPYRKLIENKRMAIDPNTITIENYNLHYNSVLNIMKDLIETDYMRHTFIRITFGPGCACDLAIVDYWFNLIMWYLIIRSGQKITGKHVLFERGVKRSTIKNYIDKFFIEKAIGKIDSIEMNNIIDDTLYRIIDIDIFSLYLANTINMEDFYELAEQNPRFNEILHVDLNKVKAEDVKREGIKLADESMNIIMNSNHGLANIFRSGEGANKKQYKEFAINKGTVADGNGGVFPEPINRSYIMGGTKDNVLYHFMESSNGRTAQIIVEYNVGNSGAFARLLGLNNSDTKLHPDKNYCCDTKNFLRVTVTNDNFDKLQNRYYRTNPHGIDYKITSEDRHLIGKLIYLRSPMTCASAARGEGVCYKCYGDLAYINNNINIGKIASEWLSSALTQKMLSAKHLLDTIISTIEWNKEFEDYFVREFNIIKCREDIDFKDIKLLINPNNITSNSEDDGVIDFNQYIDSFTLLINGKRVEFGTTDGSPLYITLELLEIIQRESRKYNTDDEEVSIDMNEIKDNEIVLFGIQIFNNDLNSTLIKIEKTINSKSSVENDTVDSLLEKLSNNLKEGGLSLDSVHAEVILSNQIRDTEDIFEKPDWSIPNVPYKLITLKSALKDNPSLTVALSFEDIKRALYNPLTYKKHKPSVFDLFFMEQPQEFLSNKEQIIQKEPEMTKDGLKIVAKHVDKEKNEG